MPFTVIGTLRGKGKENFLPIGDPEELQEGKSDYEVGESRLAVTIRDGGARLFVHLDESKGATVRPFGDEADRIMVEHGVIGIEFDERLLPDGRTVARLSDVDDAGTLYQYQVVVHRPNS